MEKTLGCGLWVVTALYVAVGVFSVAFHNALPDVRQLTDGYGVRNAATALLQSAN